MRKGVVLSTVSLPNLVAPPAPRTSGGLSDEFEVAVKLARPTPEEWQSSDPEIDWLPSSGGANHRSPDVARSAERAMSPLRQPGPRFGMYVTCSTTEDVTSVAEEEKLKEGTDTPPQESTAPLGPAEVEETDGVEDEALAT